MLFPNFFHRLLKNLPIPRKLTLIMVLFSMVICILLMLSYFGMEILSGSRAYVGGESLWSKGQKEAVYRLSRYAALHQETDYQKYLQSIAIPMGDHKALQELSKQPVDKTATALGFIQGHNHPADVGILIFMAQKFHDFPYMNKALSIWAQADRKLLDLETAAVALHREISSGHPSPAQTNTLLEQIQSVDAQLTPLEDEFSYTLGEGARWLKHLLLTLMVLATLAFLVITLIIALAISRHLCQEIDQLRAGASRIAGGDYSITLDVESNDEIGDLARTFQVMAAQRQQAERLKDEFFANVSHELRTPLTLILSPLESLLAGERSPRDVETLTALQTMHNNAIRLLQLVNGLLDFSKLEAGKMQVNREPLQISQLTEMIYKDFQPMITERKLEARLEMAPRDIAVLMDRYLYERIVFNLLSNAVKFTRPGGRLNVLLKWSADRLTLSISDTGIGIPLAELKNIFQRFRQVEGSSSRRFEGTGIGLALVKEFASLLDGSVTVESRIGQGSQFTVTCAAPRAAETVPATTLDYHPVNTRAQQYGTAFAIPASPASSDDQLPKVLIAEDNTEMASYIASLLRPFCRTMVAENGNRALACVRDWSPDLILSDVMMPERDGLSLCREIKSNTATTEIPVVILTALTHREALLEGWKAGANEYLFKPFHPQELITRIQSLLKARLERRKAEEQINLLNDTLRDRAGDLETANRELEAFSYSVSHDLRAPLRAIDGFSKELLDNCGPNLDHRGQQDLQRIRAATGRMSQLIDSLLELSHLSRSELAVNQVDLTAMADGIVEELQKAHPGRTVKFNSSPNLMARGDTRLLRVALENLLNNAWKFTQTRSQAIVEFGIMKSNGQNAFYVKDNGVGFDMAYAGKLFGAFQRLHDSKDFAGNGIGLALVQRIVHRHGGRIWAEAMENGGATFYFTL